MTSSMVKARVISDMISGKDNEYADVFSPQRFNINKRPFIHAAEIVKKLFNPYSEKMFVLGMCIEV